MNWRENPTGLLATASSVSSSTCQEPLPPSASRKFLRVSFTPLLLPDWLRPSAGCQPPPLREPGWSGGRGKRKNRIRGERKINFKLTRPTGCQSYFRDPEGCLSWQDLTSRGREVTKSIRSGGQRGGLGGLTCSLRWLTWRRIEPIHLSATPKVAPGNQRGKESCYREKKEREERRG